MGRRAWRWGLGAVGATLVLAGLIVGDAFRRAEAVYGRAQTEVAALEARRAGRLLGRLPFLQPPLSGSAWDRYRQALPSWRGMDRDEKRAIPEMALYLSRDPANPIDEERLARIFEKFRPAVALLEEALRCTVADPALPVDHGLNDHDSMVWGAEVAGVFVAGEAAFHRRAGRPELCVNRLETGFGFAQDIGRMGSIVNRCARFAIDGSLMVEARSFLASARRAPALLEAFAAALVRLDNAEPEVLDALDLEHLAWLRRLQGMPPWPYELRDGSVEKPGIRHLGSERLQIAAALTAASMAWERMREILEGPSERWKTGFEELLAQRWENHRIHSWIIDVHSTGILEIDHRLLRSLLRTTLAAARFASARGSFPEKVDDLVPEYLPRVPLCARTGEPLRTRGGKVWCPTEKEGADSLRVWTAAGK